MCSTVSYMIFRPVVYQLGENSSPPLPSKVASHQVSSSPASVRGKVTLSVLSRNSSMVDGSPTSSHQLDQHDGNFERRLSAIESKLDQFDGKCRLL